VYRSTGNDQTTTINLQQITRGIMKRYTIIYMTSLRRGTSTRGRCLCSLLLSAPGMNYYYSETQLLHTRMHAFDLLHCSAAQRQCAHMLRDQKEEGRSRVSEASPWSISTAGRNISTEKRNQKRSCFAKRPFPRRPRRRHEPCILKRSDS
jgi:hypothetical protein